MAVADGLYFQPNRLGVLDDGWSPSERAAQERCAVLSGRYPIGERDIERLICTVLQRHIWAALVASVTARVMGQPSLPLALIIHGAA